MDPHQSFNIWLALVCAVFYGVPAVSYNARMSRSHNDTCVVHTNSCAIPLPNTQCLDLNINYTTPTDSLSVPSLALLHSNLDRLYIMKKFSRCWLLVQLLACYLIYPTCKDNHFQLPHKHLCLNFMEKCSIFHFIVDDSSFFNCSLFPVLSCEPTYKLLPENNGDDDAGNGNISRTSCPFPLVPTGNAARVYSRPTIARGPVTLDGCALPCHDPLYSRGERLGFIHFAHYVFLAGCFVAFFTVMTYVINWYVFRAYSSNLSMLSINLCLLMINCGFFFQSFIKNRDDIVCNNDNTLITYSGQSDTGKYCLFVFFLIYYFSLSLMCWFVALSLSWYSTLCVYDSNKAIFINRFGKYQTLYFHYVCWFFPLFVFLIVFLLKGFVQANDMYGICFVGFNNWFLRFIFVLTPLILSICFGEFFIIKSIFILFRYRLTRVLQSKRRAIYLAIVRLVLFSCGVFALLVCVLVLHSIEYYQRSWHDSSLFSLLVCLFRSPHFEQVDGNLCDVGQRVSPTVMSCHLVCVLAATLLFSSWLWQRASVSAWQRFFNRFIGNSNGWYTSGGRIRKHHVIANAWSKRHQLSRHGRLSLSIHSAYSDPLGVCVGWNSGNTCLSNSSFFAAMPNLLERRGALLGSTSSALGLKPATGVSQRTASCSSLQSATASHLFRNNSFSCSSILLNRSVCHDYRSARCHDNNRKHTSAMSSFRSSFRSLHYRRHSLDSLRSLAADTSALCAGGRDHSSRVRMLLFGAHTRDRRKAICLPSPANGNTVASFSSNQNLFTRVPSSSCTMLRNSMSSQGHVGTSGYRFDRRMSTGRHHKRRYVLQRGSRSGSLISACKNHVRGHNNAGYTASVCSQEDLGSIDCSGSLHSDILPVRPYSRTTSFRRMFRVSSKTSFEMYTISTADVRSNRHRK